MNRGPRSVRRGAPLQSRLASMVSLALDFGDTGSLVDRRSGVVPYFTRATTASVPGFEKLDYAISGEARFGGMRRVRNLIAISSEAITNSHGWNNQIGGTGSNVTTTANYAANPVDGRVTATRLQFDRGAGTTSGDYSGLITTPVTTAATGQSIYLRSNDSNTYSINIDVGGGEVTLSVTPTWQRFFNPNTHLPSSQFAIRIRGNVGAFATPDIVAFGAQQEEIVGQANQNPSEYVSVGAAKRNELLYTSQIDISGANPWNNVTLLTSVANAVTAPDGSLTASRLVEAAGTNQHQCRQVVTTVAAAYTFSVYLKAGERDYAWLYDLGSGTGKLFDLANGTVLGNVTAPPTSAAIESVGNGWYRCSITFTTTAASNSFFIGLSTDGTTISYAGDTANGIYAWGAQLELGSTTSSYFKIENVYPYHGAMVDGVKYFPTENGNTVASNVVTEATGPGLNLYASAWFNGAAGTYLSTPDSVANSPSGSVAFEIDATAVDWSPAGSQVLVGKWGCFAVYIGGGSLGFEYQPTGGGAWRAVAVSPTFTDRTRRRLRITYNYLTGKANFYDSSDGVTWAPIGAEQTMTAGAINDSAASLYIATGDSADTLRFEGVVHRIKIFDSIDATDPVVDCNPYDWTSGSTFTSSTTGEVWTLNGSASITKNTRKGLLIEEARTNLCLYSQTLANAGWNSGANCAVTDNFYTAPDGTTTAAKVYPGATNAQHYIARNDVAYTAAAYTASVYMKYVNHRWAMLATYDGVTARYVSVDLLNGVLGTVTGATATGTITAVGNGWYRVTMTFTAAATASGHIDIALNDADGTDIRTWNAAGTEFVAAWGAQAELGSEPSTYIPTTTAAVARNADVAAITSLGGWFNTTEGTLVAEVIPSDVAVAHGVAAFDDDTANERINLAINASAAGVLTIVDGGVSQAALTQGTLAANVAATLVAGWKLNDVAVSVEGAAVGTDVVATMPAVTRLRFGTNQAGEYLNGYIKRLNYYPRRLPNTVLPRLST